MKIKQQPDDFRVDEIADFTPAAAGAHYIYRLEKKSLTTLDVLDMIAERYKVDQRALQVCGLKDKHAHTTQLVSARRELPQQSTDTRWNLTLLGRSDKPVGSDNLKANRFSITVRHLTHDQVEAIPARLQEIGQHGLENYFDSQRFGSVRHGSEFMAKRLINRDAQGAVRLFLTDTSGKDPADVRKRKNLIIERWGEWGELARTLPRCPERPVIRHLSAHANDFVGAFLKINRQLRTMFIFAYQSYIWNETVKRLLHGAQRVDLVADYAIGELWFHIESNEADAMQWRTLTVPLIKHTSQIEAPDVAKAVGEVLATEGLTLADFTIKIAPSLFFKEVLRPMLLFPSDPTWEALGHDPLNKGRYHGRLSFTLPPGAYATLLIKRLFQCKPGPNKPEHQPGFVPRAADDAHDTGPDEVEEARPTDSSPDLDAIE